VQPLIIISNPAARFRVCLGDDAPWGKLNLNIISICGGKDATWQRHQQQQELSAVPNAHSSDGSGGRRWLLLLLYLSGVRQTAWCLW